MQQIVATILEEVKQQHAVAVHWVTLEIGDLTFLGHEQLSFAFSLLSEGTPLEHAELFIRPIRASVKCSCGFEGDAADGFKEDFHLSFPILKCPRCGGSVDVVKGRECIIKTVNMEVSDHPTKR